MKTNPLLLAVLTALALPNDTTEERGLPPGERWSSCELR